MRYVPRATAFPAVSYKEEYLLEGGRLFGLTRSGGGVRPAFAAKSATLIGEPSSAQAVYYSSGGNLYLYDSGTLYRSVGASAGLSSYASGFSSAPCLAECHGNDAHFTLITDGSNAFRATQQAIGSVTAPPVDMCVSHYGRLFGIDVSDRYRIRWSGAGDALGWSESITGAGYVRLDLGRGEVQKLVVYDNKLLAVRKYGLTVIRAFGDAESFRVDVTDTDADEIVAQTAAVCAGKLCLFTSSGMYTYDGDVEKFSCEGLAGFNGVTCAAAGGGYYYACGKFDGADVIACIDVAGGEVSYLKARADCICGNGRVFFYGDGLYEIVTEGDLSGGWESGPVDFGTPQKKYLKGVTVVGSCTLTVECGGRSRTFTDAEGELKVGMCGTSFNFALTCADEVASLCARYVLRG